jgi:hypothetical protein
VCLLLLFVGADIDLVGLSQLRFVGIQNIFLLLLLAQLRIVVILLVIVLVIR